jgi:hypothetical protein
MYHSTIYGGANGVGRTVEEARLEAVLGLARAITDDETAFDHDADEIFKAEQYRWWQCHISDVQEMLDAGEVTRKRGRRRIKLLEQLMAEWQEDHDYWPEEKTEADARIEVRAAQIREHTRRRRAASAHLSALAAAARANAREPESRADHVLASGHGDDEAGN